MNRSLQMKSVLRLLLLGCVMTSLHAVANPITRQQAQQNALAFMKERGKSVSMASLRHAPMRAAQPDEPQPYYVFNIGDNQGYVIASGDDCAYAVLGYSDEGAIDLNNLPCNLQAWLEGYAHQIQYLQEHDMVPSRAPRKSSYPQAIAPLLTSQWAQGYPYNMYCPILAATGCQSLTGCVGTATAQIMYYFRDRSINQTLEDIPGYDQDNGIHVDTIPAGSVIDWGNMLDRYNPGGGTDTDEQRQAVANLMLYCGTAMRMEYSMKGSSTSYASDGYAMVALIKSFNYSNKARTLYRGNYTNTDDEIPNYSNEEWETIIYNELADNRPVLYGSGSTTGISHSFVCDGYDGNGYYHINFGYGGGSPSIGYYLLSASDSESVLSGWDVGHEAVILLEPRPDLPDLNAGIHFDNIETKVQCLIKWDENDDGVLSFEEAAAVSEISNTVFIYKKLVTSFDELKYFTGLTTIGNSAFAHCTSLTSVTIPNSVATIDSSAFAYCTALPNVTIPNSVATIDNSAFAHCTGLTSLTIPNSVVTIGNSAFAHCTGLTNVSIPNSVATIGNFAFVYCTALPSVTIPNSVATIGNYAFAYCTALPSVTIPNSVATIGNYAFAYCNGLTSVTIPSSVTSIGSHVFDECNNLKNLTWNAKNCPSFRCPLSIEHLTFGDEVEVIPDNFASDCSVLTSVTIPKSVTTIGEEAFIKCNGLKSVTIPSTVTSLGRAAFYNCDGLTNVAFYAPVVSRLAFEDCSNLKSITLGKSVKSIEHFAFYGCENLQTVTCLALNPPELSVSFSFDNDLQQFKVPTLRVPIDAVDAYKAHMVWQKFPNIVGIDPSLGDVNLDGEVNIADVNSIVDNILTNSDDYMSDANRDGEVNIADINTLIDIILSH